MNGQDVRRLFNDGHGIHAISRFTGWAIPDIFEELGRMADEEFARYVR